MTIVSRFRIPKMDCAAEEQMVRSVLDGLAGIRELEFDLPGRRLAVYHDGEAGLIGERRTLQLLLAINASMFLVEQFAGRLASSAGLLADSLDMLADASVYGIALYAVGRSSDLKRRAGHISGWMQLALAANVARMALISRHREGGVHMKASWIFSTNDVIANIGVVVAGALVAWTGTRFPDLAIGALIAAIVASGAWRILRLR